VKTTALAPTATFAAKPTNAEEVSVFELGNVFTTDGANASEVAVTLDLSTAGRDLHNLDPSPFPSST
jgi:hypothetical protein